MNGRLRGIILISLALLALPGCAVSRVEKAAVPIRAVRAPGNIPEVSVEKVVTMVTQAEKLTPTVVATRGIGPSPTPPSFADFGLTTVRYTDPLSGVSFEYPTSWQFTDLTPEQKQSSTIYSMTLHSPMPTPSPKQQEGALPPGVAAVDIAIWKDQVKSYAEAVALRLKQNTESGTPVKFADTHEIILSGGVKATRFDLDTPHGRVIEVVTYTKNGMLLIDASGDTTLFETILATIRVP